MWFLNNENILIWRSTCSRNVTVDRDWFCTMSNLVYSWCINLIISILGSLFSFWNDINRNLAKRISILKIRIGTPDRILKYWIRWKVVRISNLILGSLLMNGSCPACLILRTLKWIEWIDWFCCGVLWFNVCWFDHVWQCLYSWLRCWRWECWNRWCRKEWTRRCLKWWKGVIVINGLGLRNVLAQFRWLV